MTMMKINSLILTWVISYHGAGGSVRVSLKDAK